MKMPNVASRIVERVVFMRSSFVKEVGGKSGRIPPARWERKRGFKSMLSLPVQKGLQQTRASATRIPVFFEKDRPSRQIAGEGTVSARPRQHRLRHPARPTGPPNFNRASPREDDHAPPPCPGHGRWPTARAAPICRPLPRCGNFGLFLSRFFFDLDIQTDFRLE